MNNYASQSNNSAGCHIWARFSEPNVLRGFTVTTAGPPPKAPAQIHTRLVEAGLPVERFVDLQNGTKAPTVSHTDPENQFGAERVKGNYGVLAGQGLIIIDVDAPEELPTWLVRLLAQNPTLAVSSPHGSDARGHYFYRVEGTIETDKATLKGDWGSILLERSYAVGPGSVIDHDTYCEGDCSLSDQGWYDLLDDRPIARLQAESLQEAIPDDQDNHSVASDPVDADVQDLDARIERGLDGNVNFQDLWHWARQGGPPARVGFPNDRSGAETALSAHLNFWLSGNTDAVREEFNQVRPPKWDESGESYRQSIVETGDNGVYYNPDAGGGGISWNAIFEVILALCYDHEGRARTREIAASEYVEVGQRQIVNVLNQLQEMGYLDKKQDAEDGRIEYWVVTDMEGLVEFERVIELFTYYSQLDYYYNRLLS